MLNSCCIPTKHVLNIDCVGLTEEYVCVAFDIKGLSQKSYACEDLSKSFCLKRIWQE